jgi:uroporphyrinogen decarboxylase
MTYYGSINKIEILNTGQPYTWYVSPYLRTPEMLVKWFDEKGWPDQMKVDSYPSETVSVNKEYSHTIHIIPSYGPSVFTHLQQMLGLDRLSYFSRKAPDVLRRIIESFTELQLKQIAQMKPLHPIAAFTFDDLGQKDRALLSPEMFRKFFAPERKRVNDAIHELGAKSILHSCGNVTELLPELITAGFDGWQTLEPASGIDHAQVKLRFGDQLSFWGAVDNNMLCFGTPAEVKDKARHMLQIMSPGGGYVYGPAHDYLNTKVDNALALRDSLIQYGFYPNPGN